MDAFSAMVNQKLALQTGFIPCSTVKLVTSLAALTENLVNKGTIVHIKPLPDVHHDAGAGALNNQYFNILGTRLASTRFIVTRKCWLRRKGGPGYSRRAGWRAAGGCAAERRRHDDQLGSGISMTPLELAALLSAISNGGTLYYLQYPHSQEEAEHFEPRFGGGKLDGN